MAEWFYQNSDGEAVGPLSGGDLKKCVADGLIGPQTLINRDGGAWVSAVRVKGLVFPIPTHAETPPTPVAAMPESNRTEPVETSEAEVQASRVAPENRRLRLIAGCGAVLIAGVALVVFAVDWGEDVAGGENLFIVPASIIEKEPGPPLAGEAPRPVRNGPRASREPGPGDFIGAHYDEVRDQLLVSIGAGRLTQVGDTRTRMTLLVRLIGEGEGPSAFEPSVHLLFVSINSSWQYLRYRDFAGLVDGERFQGELRHEGDVVGGKIEERLLWTCPLELASAIADSEEAKFAIGQDTYALDDAAKLALSIATWLIEEPSLLDEMFRFQETNRKDVEAKKAAEKTKADLARRSRLEAVKRAAEDEARQRQGQAWEQERKRRIAQEFQERWQEAYQRSLRMGQNNARQYRNQQEARIVRDLAEKYGVSETEVRLAK